VLIASRGHKEDLRLLRWAAGTKAHYIGMLGSRRKVITIGRALLAEGVPAARLEGVHAPVGLDLGASTPEEIAVAVVAELIALRRRCAATVPHLRLLRQLTEKPAAAPAPLAAAAG
jgi:xanthine dehydrogenase accessory factor